MRIIRIMNSPEPKPATPGQPAPAGMHCSHHRTGIVTKQNRQTVGRHHGADHTALTGPDRIGFSAGDRGSGVKACSAMHLL